jgi:hypothetical protein
MIAATSRQMLRPCLPAAKRGQPRTQRAAKTQKIIAMPHETFGDKQK